MARPLVAVVRTAIQPTFIRLRRLYLRKVWGMDLGVGCQISFTAKLDRTNPAGIHIGDYSVVTFGAVLLTHDMSRNRTGEVRIGNYCFIGARSIVMPGVTIGDHSIVGAGSVVLKDLPPHSLAVGNPARILKSDIETGPYGILAAAPTANRDGAAGKRSNPSIAPAAS